MERAFQLARSGEVRTLGDLQKQLKREGFIQVEAHLDGKSTKAQIMKLIAEAARRD